MRWEDDQVTRYWAELCPLGLGKAPRPQFGGAPLAVPITAATWRQRITARQFPAFVVNEVTDKLRCTPENIIRCCKERCFLEALVLTIGWGSMVRRSNQIYRETLAVIDDALRTAVALMDQDGAVKGAWAVLRDDLKWSDVISSKFLHFAARALGYATDPPVPIDWKVCRGPAWRAFKSGIAKASAPVPSPLASLPGRWSDRTDSWRGYVRYMTAVRCWATARGWTTTEVENTLYDMYKDP